MENETSASMHDRDTTMQDEEGEELVDSQPDENLPPRGAKLQAIAHMERVQKHKEQRALWLNSVRVQKRQEKALRKRQAKLRRQPKPTSTDEQPDGSPRSMTTSLEEGELSERANAPTTTADDAMDP